MCSTMASVLVPGPNTALTPISYRPDVVIGDDAADDHQHVVQPFGPQQFEHARTSAMCAPLRIDRPTTSTSSCSAASAIISGV